VTKPTHPKKQNPIYRDAKTKFERQYAMAAAKFAEDLVHRAKQLNSYFNGDYGDPAVLHSINTLVERLNFYMGGALAVRLAMAELKKKGKKQCRR
jgi:hypothetical protein